MFTQLDEDHGVAIMVGKGLGMKTLTEDQTRELSDLRTCLFVASNKIFDATPGSDICFLTCYAAAPVPIRMAHDMAVDNLQAFERAMVSEGRGHPDLFRHFQAYSRGR